MAKKKTPTPPLPELVKSIAEERATQDHDSLVKAMDSLYHIFRRQYKPRKNAAWTDNEAFFNYLKKLKKLYQK
jgi:hypothetical protein